MLILKAVDSKLQSKGGFQWPESGYVACLDWDPTDRCGGGLHGWANGEGDYIHHEYAHWLVVDVPDASVVVITEDGGGKVKFPSGTVVFSGTQASAVAYLISHGSLNTNSNPAWACFSPSQCASLAKAASERAARYDANAARAARAAYYAADAANAANANAKYAANANAKYAAGAANAAYYAADAARYATHAAYAANAANANAAYYARCAESEALRKDKLSLLGII